MNWVSIKDLAADERNAIVDGPFGSNLKTSDYVDKGIPVLQGKNITNNCFKWFDIRYIAAEKAKELSRSKVVNGDVLMVKIGSIGYVAEINNLKDSPYAIIPANLAKITLNRSIVDSKYFCFCFQNQTIKSRLLSLASKTAQPALSLSKIKDFKIPLHPIHIQKQIAQLLEEAHIARQKRKAANALTDQFLQSTFRALFGDPISNEKGFAKASIANLKCHVQIGPFGTQLHVEDYIENGIPLINPTHIQDKKVVENLKLTITKEKHAELSNYHLKDGDIIMARRGEMARCAIITKREENWLCGTGSLFVRPSKNLISIFLLYVLSHSSIKRKLENDAQGVTMANLNKTIIENLEIINPPLDLQQKFASIVADIEQLRQKQKQSEIELENLFQALLQKYFG